MDYDYPTPDIYDCDLVDNVCPCGAYIPDGDRDCDQGLLFQGKGFDCPGKDIRERDSNCSILCNFRTKRRVHLPENPQKEIAVLRKLGINADKNGDEKETPPPVDCCPHKCKDEEASKRTFLLTFNNRGDDDCMQLEKIRCKAFWDFVESEEILQGLIKDGEFVYEAPPHAVKATTRIGPLFFKKSKKKAEVDAQAEQFLQLAERDRAIHEDENRRLFKQRQKNIELVQKSGQPKFIHKSSRQNAPQRENKYADMCDPAFDEVLQEMKIFDRLTKNPVQTPDFLHDHCN